MNEDEMVAAAFVTLNRIGNAFAAWLEAKAYGGPVEVTGSPIPGASQVSAGAVSVEESITPDHIVSMIDGRRYKSLKRHLTGHGLTPETYREKFGLPSNYPMVAANYAAHRSNLAKASGLGRKPAPAPIPEPTPVVAPRRRAKAA